MKYGSHLNHQALTESVAIPSRHPLTRGHAIGPRKPDADGYIEYDLIRWLEKKDLIDDERFVNAE